MVKISAFQALIAKKENLKSFSIKSYLEYSDIDIKNKLKKDTINYLKIITSSKKDNNGRFKEINNNLQNCINKKILIKQEEVEIMGVVAKIVIIPKGWMLSLVIVVADGWMMKE